MFAVLWTLWARKLPTATALWELGVILQEAATLEREKISSEVWFGQ